MITCDCVISSFQFLKFVRLEDFVRRLLVDTINSSICPHDPRILFSKKKNK